jgi:hypothetical protein
MEARLFRKSECRHELVRPRSRSTALVSGANDQQALSESPKKSALSTLNHPWIGFLVAMGSEEREALSSTKGSTADEDDHDVP